MQAPWSSSLNPGRLAAAWRRAGFGVRVVSSSGAARDGLDVSDVLACEVLSLPCDRSGRASWSHYGRAVRRSGEALTLDQ